MRERGIIFNAEMVRAILDGRKTQTRRVMQFQPESPSHGIRFITEAKSSADIGKYFWSESNALGNRARSKLFTCPFGQPGDRLWVRETWSEDFANYYPNDRVWYAANDDRRRDIEIVDGVRGIYSPESDVHVPFRWRPSIHMPRWASRITLEITGVRVERLCDISDEEAGKEGYPANPYPFGGRMDKWLWFRQLWDSIYPNQSFKHNPWVWVVEFKRVEDGQP